MVVTLKLTFFCQNSPILTHDCHLDPGNVVPTTLGVGSLALSGQYGLALSGQ